VKKITELKIQGKYEVKVIDTKTGEVLKLVKGEGGTFNSNFARLLALLMFPAGDTETSLGVTDIDKVVRTMRSPDDEYPPTRYIVDPAYRIEVGIGKSGEPFERTQYRLLDPQAWVACPTYTITDDGTKVIVEFSGSWLNDTGALVTIREIGFRCRFLDETNYVSVIMLARDVITPTDIPAEGTVTVSYDITIPF